MQILDKAQIFKLSVNTFSKNQIQKINVKKFFDINSVSMYVINFDTNNKLQIQLQQLA